MKIFHIGIDPGITGAAGVLDSRGNYIEVFDMPLKSIGAGRGGRTRNIIDCLKLAQWLSRFQRDGGAIYAYIERQQATPLLNRSNEDDIRDIFSRCYQNHRMAGIPQFEAQRKALIDITRDSAKNTPIVSIFTQGRTYGAIESILQVLQIGYDEIEPQNWKRAYGLRSNKELARALAMRLFPDAPLSRKKDHNRAEALLIARHGIDKTKGKDFAA